MTPESLLSRAKLDVERLKLERSSATGRVVSVVVAPYQFCEKPPLGNMSRNTRKKKGTYNFIRQKPGGGGVAGDHSWWNK